MQIHTIIWVYVAVHLADESAVGAIMVFNKIIGVLGNPLRADKSAMGAINRPLLMAGLIC